VAARTAPTVPAVQVDFGAPRGCAGVGGRAARVCGCGRARRAGVRMWAGAPRGCGRARRAGVRVWAGAPRECAGVGGRLGDEDGERVDDERHEHLQSTRPPGE